jgi:aryl-alcohol dehydrogenase-like predicted oxidoreductase
MQYQQLGDTGVFVSRLCFGAMTFGGSGTIYEMIGTDKDSRRAKFDFPRVAVEKDYAIIDVLREIGQRRAASVAQIALAWLLHQPHVTSVIIGAKKLSQLKDNLAAVDVKLTAEDLQQLDAVSRLTPEYPGWMSEVQGTDRRPGQVRDWSKLTRS